MKKKFFVVAAIIISSQLQAQQDTTGRVLDEVSVTATKSAIKQSQTGKVVTIIDSATLSHSQGKDLAQLLTEQAGIVINGATSNPGKDKSVFLRGAKNDYTVILINGIAVTDPSGVTGAFDLRLLPVEQIERIEIVKGAQSTLYGSNAIAGVINIITRKGADTPAQLFGNFSAGSFGTFKANAGLRGSTGKTSYDIGFIHHETTGISEAKDTTANKSFDKDGVNQNGISINFDGEVMEQLHIQPWLRYTHFKGDYDDASFTDAANRYTSSLLSTGATARWNYKKGAVVAQYSYDEISRLFNNAAFGPSSFEGRNKTAEIYTTMNLGDHFQWLAGIDHRHQRSVDTNASPKNPTINITSPYLSLFVKNIKGFNLEIGSRFNDHSKYGSHFTYSINPSWLIAEKVKIFANIASAFRAPSLSELYGQFGANPDLDPEKSQTYEGGAQASVGLLDIRGVFFFRKVKDVIIFGSPGYINFDKQEDHGFEIEPSLRINNKMQLKLYYAFVDGEVTTQIAGKDTSFFNLLRRPKHSFGLTASYQVLPKLFVSTNLYNYSDRTDTDFNFFPALPVVLKSYFLWNMYAEYAVVAKKLKLFVDLKNLTDTDYEEVYGYSTQGFNIIAGVSFNLY